MSCLTVSLPERLGGHGLRLGELLVLPVLFLENLPTSPWLGLYTRIIAVQAHNSVYLLSAYYVPDTTALSLMHVFKEKSFLHLSEVPEDTPSQSMWEEPWLFILWF